MLVKITDTGGEVYHINPQNVVYIKERPNHGLWKVVVVNGESIMTKDKLQAQALLDCLENK
jgi:uncharacterized protein YybS (DUF2232 family)